MVLSERPLEVLARKPLKQWLSDEVKLIIDVTFYLFFNGLQDH
jgi:hypothetical protein